MGCRFCDGDIQSESEVANPCTYGNETEHSVCTNEWTDRVNAELCVYCKKPLEMFHYMDHHDGCSKYEGYPPSPCR